MTKIETQPKKTNGSRIEKQRELGRELEKTKRTIAQHATTSTKRAALVGANHLTRLHTLTQGKHFNIEKSELNAIPRVAEAALSTEHLLVLMDHGNETLQAVRQMLQILGKPMSELGPWLADFENGLIQMKTLQQLKELNWNDVAIALSKDGNVFKMAGALSSTILEMISINAQRKKASEQLVEVMSSPTGPNEKFLTLWSSPGFVFLGTITLAYVKAMQSVKEKYDLLNRERKKTVSETSGKGNLANNLNLRFQEIDKERERLENQLTQLADELGDFDPRREAYSSDEAYREAVMEHSRKIGSLVDSSVEYNDIKPEADELPHQLMAAAEGAMATHEVSDAYLAMMSELLYIYHSLSKGLGHVATSFSRIVAAVIADAANITAHTIQTATLETTQPFRIFSIVKSIDASSQMLDALNAGVENMDVSEAAQQIIDGKALEDDE
jgi:hypothetical protein